jgi:diaminopimelate epimerase
MQFKFWKYHGLGNDFILIDTNSIDFAWTPELAQAVCDRHRGIGADGVMLVSSSENADFRMVIYNADGSRPEMCGNGLRCFVRYLFEQGFTAARAFSVETDRGVLACEVLGEGNAIERIRVEMGAPILECAAIPMTGEPGRCLDEPLTCDGDTLSVSAVSMGNPHLITFDWTDEQQVRLAPLLEAHPRFPNKTNVEFVRVVDREATVPVLDVIVYERGCGYTDACGTGACAVAVAAILTERVPHAPEIEVRLPGGPLGIEVAENLSNVWLIGPAVPVFHGTWVAD